MYVKILATYHADIIYQTFYQYGQSAVAGVLFFVMPHPHKHIAHLIIITIIAL